MIEKKFLFLIICSLFLCRVFPQVNSEAIEIDKEISSLSSKIQKTDSVETKISLLEKKAMLLEGSNSFEHAEETYFQCAEIAESQKKFSYILSAVRCSLCYGNSERADELLAKIASAARNNEFAPIFKLYAVWSWLGKCTTYEETFEPVAILKSYLEVESMSSVKTQILFTLWYVTKEKKYSDELVSSFPQSAETAISVGKAELYPSPFWFFICRKN